MSMRVFVRETLPASSRKTSCRRADPCRPRSLPPVIYPMIISICTCNFIGNSQSSLENDESRDGEKANEERDC